MATNTAQAPKAPASTPAKQPESAKRPAKAPLSEAEKAAKERAKQAKFQEIARPRLARVLKGMRQLENVGRGSAYAYTPDQANKLLQHLVDGVGRVKVAFAPKVRGSAAAQELPEL